jgi:hypothetical protein
MLNTDETHTAIPHTYTPHTYTHHTSIPHTYTHHTYTHQTSIAHTYTHHTTLTIFYTLIHCTSHTSSLHSPHHTDRIPTQHLPRTWTVSADTSGRVEFHCPHLPYIVPCMSVSSGATGPGGISLSMPSIHGLIHGASAPSALARWNFTVDTQRTLAPCISVSGLTTGQVEFHCR